MPGAGRKALLALGSYARQELCPGSDIDVLLLHDGAGDVRQAADALWYPLWDAGLIVGHSTRTVKEAVTVADGDVQVLTSMLEVRCLAGDEELAAVLTHRVRQLAQKRRNRLVDALSRDSAARATMIVADLLEPNLKEGGGGLRDLHALDWVGWSLGDPGGLDALIAGGYLEASDRQRLDEARHLLLVARVALHRVTGGKADELLLQDQDAVAAVAGFADADDLARQLAAACRSVAWIAADVWDRLRSTKSGPLGRIARRDRPLADGVVLRDGRVALKADAPADGAAALRLAAAAATEGATMARDALARLAEGADEPTWQPAWDAGAGEDFLRLLRQGRRAIPVIESLDQTGIWGALVPEWEHVRSLPQRNAYHRFTVDRHLLEAVAECAAILDGEDDGSPGRGFDADVAEHLDRPELLVLAALCHDIGKGLPGDHSEVGVELARSLCGRIGVGAEATARMETIVRHHLLLADVATRRDLSEEATVARVARLVQDAPTLEVLYLLTIGDSRATGPAAWGPVKAALVRELFVKALNLLERGDVEDTWGAERRRALSDLLGAEAAAAHLDAMPPSYLGAFTPEEMVRHRALLDARDVVTEWGTGIEDRPVVTVVAPDRPGLLAAVAGVLSAHGLSVQEAAIHTRADGMALEVMRVYDTYGRLARQGVPDEVLDDIRSAIAGDVDVPGRVQARAERYQPARRRTKPPTPPEVRVDQEASDFASVVEVHADDRVGLLFQITSVFDELGLDVHLAKVNTIGDRVVDAFYVRDASGGKLSDPAQIESLRHTLMGRLLRI